MIVTVTPQTSFSDERLQIRKLVELVTSRSSRTPALLRMEAAERLLEAQQTVADFLEYLALREFEDGG